MNIVIPEIIWYYRFPLINHAIRKLNIRSVSMELIQTQIAFFFKSDFNKDFEWFSLTLKELFGKSNQTIQIPIGDSEPGELPRLTLIYDRFTFNVAKKRLDVIIRIDLFDPIIKQIVQNALRKLDIRIGRLGFVKTFFLQTDQDILKKALNSELQPRDFSEISIRVNEPFTFSGLRCNNIEKIEAGEAQKIDGNRTLNFKGILIQRDINISPMNDTVLTEDQILQFVNHFESLSNTRLLNL